MIKCTITIPVSNSDGLSSDSQNRGIVKRLTHEFGNCTASNRVTVHRPGGTAGVAMRLFVYVAPMDVGRLRDAVAEICRTLGLDSIQFERSLPSVEDIDPAEVMEPAKDPMEEAMMRHSDAELEKLATEVQDKPPTPEVRAENDKLIDRLFGTQSTKRPAKMRFYRHPDDPPTIGQATKRAEEAFLAPAILPPETAAGSICKVVPNRGIEFGGELSTAMVARLKNMEFEVLLYSQRGVVSTVIRAK